MINEVTRSIARFGTFAFLASALLGLSAERVLADGTETLGIPSIPIAEGTGVVAAGVGLTEVSQGDISIDVPGAVQQVLLYWEGQQSTDVPGPNTITVDGNAVTGELIGGQTFFFAGAYSSAYRADITDLDLVAEGSNILTVESPGYTKASNGAGVLVIYDDGSGTASIDVRDGVDLAFVNFPEPRKSTIPQTFTFPVSDSAREANLSMFFGSVSGTISGAGADRPSLITVTVNGDEIRFENLLASNNGEEWDTLNLPFVIPAGATELTVQAFSINPNDPNNTSDPKPASFAWTAAGLSVPPPAPRATIGDFVWEDCNGNGIQDDASIPGCEFGGGIPDVPVELRKPVNGQCTDTGELVASTTTGPAGDYLFTDLDPGAYCVLFPSDLDDALDCGPGSTARYTVKNAGSDSAKDSNANPDGTTDVVDLEAGESDLTIDAGLFCPEPGQIGDFVWEDCNGNGIQDDADTPPGSDCQGGGIPDVPVELRKPDADGDCTSDGELVASTTTGMDGDYLFTDLDPDEYCVLFPSNPADALNCDAGSTASYTTKNAPGSTSENDSNANPDGSTDSIDLEAGESDLTIDAGLFCSVSIGDTLWNDLNRNGIQDMLNEGMGEPGVNDVTVTLFDCDGTQVGAPTITGPAPDDVAEPQIPGGAGWYQFEGLVPGCYVVQFDQPADFVFSPANEGNDPAVDSNVNPMGATGEIILLSRDSDQTIDAGIYRPPTAGLGDFVFEDENANGIQDPGEPGIQGVPVTLLTNPDGDPGCDSGDEMDAGLPTMLTDGSGMYMFEDLEPGNYCVEFVKAVVDCTTDGFPLGAPSFSPALQGGDPAKDSNPDTATGVTGNVNLGPDEFDPTIDAGIFCPAKLGDRVFKDCNGNGIQDDADLEGCESEVGIPGVEVKLFDCDGMPITDQSGVQETRVTDANGFYMFGAEPGVFDLKPGQYVVQFDPSTFPPDFAFSPVGQGGDDALDSDCMPPGGETACTPLGSRGINLDRDCGLIPPPPPQCDLVIDKTCRVETAPPSGDLECEAKIAATVLRYIGQGDPDEVTVTGKNNKATVDSSFEGGILTIDARPEDLGAKMTITTDGVAEVIHTSCSTPYVAGRPAPLDSPKGAPSPNWFVVSFVDKEGNSVSIPDSAEGGFTDECSFAPGPLPSCETQGKPESLTFRYLGDGPVADCTDNAASRAEKKPPTCAGNLPVGATVEIAIDKGSASKSMVAPGETFSITGFGAETEITLSGGGGSESDSFHTSCSAPLEVGDLFGNLLLVAFDGVRSSVTVTYQYEVTNLGDPVTNITVVDDKLGDIGVIPTLPANGANSAILQAVTEISETTTNTATATGMLNGEMCAAPQDSVTVTAVEPPEPTCNVSITLDKVEDKKIKWKLSNSGDVGATIDTLIVSWPGDGELKKVKFDGSDILKDVLIASPAEITSDQWLKQPKDRTLDAGDSGKKLELEFDDDFPLGKEQPPGDFDLTIKFEQGCEVNANGGPKLLEGDAETSVADNNTEAWGLGGCSAARAGQENPLGLLMFAGALLLWSRRRGTVVCPD